MRKGSQLGAQRDAWADTCSRLSRARREQVRSTGAEAVLRFAEGGSGALVNFFRGYVFLVCRDIPHVPEGVRQLAVPVPPELIRDQHQHLRAGGDGLIGELDYVLDVEEDATNTIPGTSTNSAAAGHQTRSAVGRLPAREACRRFR